MRTQAPQIESLESRIYFAVDATVLTAPESQVVQLADQWSPTAWQMDGQTASNEFGLTGAGQTVAIIDTGVAYDHYALGGGYGTSYRVVGGWDFAENDSNPYDDGPMGFHGTHVAGIVASDDATYRGVAPNVDLVALRVFDDLGMSRSEWVHQALVWVQQNQNSFEFPITTVNLSLALDNVPPTLSAQIESALSDLRNDGIFISVAAGNNFVGNLQLRDPARSESVVPVSSVGPDGTISTFSQRHPRVLAAPGESITSTAPDYLYGFDGVTDDFVQATGTSMAAPHIAGASVLLREAMKNLGGVVINQNQLYDHLAATSDLTHDPQTGRDYWRVNLSRALEVLVGDDEPVETDLGLLQSQMFVDGTVHNLDDSDTFTFQATVSGTLTSALTWSADTAAPSYALVGATPLAPGEYHVTAGQAYSLVVAAGASIGNYAVDLRMTPQSAVQFSAPMSMANQTVHTFAPDLAGLHQLHVTFPNSRGVESLVVSSTTRGLLLETALRGNQFTAPLTLQTGEEISVRITGPDPVADVTLSSAAIYDPNRSNGPGSSQNTASPMHVAADEPLHIAIAVDDSVPFANTYSADIQDIALDMTNQEPPWLGAIVAINETLSDALEKEEDQRLADEIFQHPDQVSSGVASDSA